VRIAVTVALLAACGVNVAPGVDVAREDVALVPVVAKHDVDILYVIDDSPAFLDSQNALRTAFAAFINELSVPGELPSLHIGVVTSDVGTLGGLDSEPGPGIGNGPGSCSGTGKDGELQTQNTTLVDGRFITDVRNSDGSRSVNYTGSITDAFSAIAAVGSSGCGFEQHLHAAKRALDNHPANVGFLRDNATLAIVLFTDEDDCSFAHSSFLNASDSSLGPLTSFRCTQFGVLCQQGGATIDEMNDVGTKSKCSSNEESPHVMSVGGYVEFFRSLKRDDRDVLLTTIAGDSSPFEVALTSIGGLTPAPALQNVCVAHDAINPSVRLAQLPAAFARGSFETICSLDLAPAVTSVARQIRGMLGDSCLARDIALPADCRVFDQTLASEIELSPCSAATTTDCYELVEDATCTTSQHLRIKVTRSAPPSADTMVAVRCRI
jgi:hypothetical protein